MHDALAHVLADTTSLTAIKTAFIGGLALVLSTSVPVLLSRREREPKAIRDLRKAEAALRTELEQDRNEWKKTAEQATAAAKIREAEIERLRQLCVDNGINPYIPKDEGSK